MQKAAIYVCCILLVIFGIYFSISSIDSKKYEITISKGIKEKTGFNLVAGEDSSFKLFPLPAIYFKDIKLESGDYKILTAENLIIYIDPFSIFSNEFSIKEIRIETPKVNLSNKNFNLSKWKDLLNENFMNINQIILNNGIFETSGDNNSGYHFDINNISFKTQEKSLYDIDGNIILNNENVKISSVINLQNPDSISLIKMTSDKYNINISSTINFDQKSNQFNLNGKIYSSYIKSKFITDIALSAIPGGSKKKNFYNDKNISIEGEITGDNNQLKTHNLKFISDEMSGDGEMNINLSNFINLDLKLNLASLNLDGLINSQNNNAVSEQNDKDYMRDNDLIFDQESNQQINISSDIRIGKFYYNKKVVENLKINLTSQESKLLINNFYGDFPDNLHISLQESSTVKVNDQNVLYGKLKIETPDFKKVMQWLGIDNEIKINTENALLNLDAKLILAPNEITLNEINASFLDGNILGRLTFKIDDHNNIKYDNDLEINNINFNAIQIPKLFETINTHLTSSNDNSYLAKFRWLREFDDNITAKITINNALYDNQKINNLACNFAAERGIINIQEFSVDSDNTKISSMQFLLDSRALKPNINLVINGSLVDINFIQKLFNLNNNTDASSDVVLGKWSSDNLNFFRFDKFNGNIKINLDKINYQKLELSDMKFIANMNHEKMFINTLDFKTFEGSLESKGTYYYNLNGFNYSMTTSISNVKIIPLLKLLINNDKIDGYINHSSSFYTFGLSAADLIKNLELNSKFAAKDVIISGIDIQKIVDITSAAKDMPEASKIEEVNKALYEGSSVLSSADGDIIIKNGNLQSKDITFKSYYSNGYFILSINLQDWLLNSNFGWTFLPSSNSDPVVISIGYSGLLDKYKKTVNKENLINFISGKVNSDSKNKGTNSKNDNKELYQVLGNS